MASRPDIKLEIGLGAGVYQPLADVVWTDASAWLRGDVGGISIRRGRSSDTGAVDSGRMSLTLDNRDGELWPANALTANPGSSLYPNVDILRRIRLSARVADGDPWTPLYTGYIRSWQPIGGRGGRDACVVLDCVDVLTPLERKTITTSAATIIDSAAVDSALDSMFFPAADVAIEDSAETTLAQPAQTGVVIATWLRRIANDSDALLYVAGDGVLTYQTRGYRQATRTPVATFTTDDGIAVWVLGQSDLGINTVLRDSGWAQGDVDGAWYSEARWSYDDARLVNVARVTRDGGAQQEATNALSRIFYDDYVASESGLILVSDTEALARAQYRVIQNGFAQLRAEMLQVDASAAPAATWAALLALELNALVAVVDFPVWPGDSVRLLCRIGGLTHDIGLTDWRVTLKLEPDVAVIGLLLDDPEYGVLDSQYAEMY